MMNSFFGEQMNYVEAMLHRAGRDQGRRHAFRSRTKHTKRVLKWAQRLSKGRNDLNTDVLYTAVIFHDLGYVYPDLQEHQVESARLFMEYATQQNLDIDFARQVEACIRIHSDKWRMAHPQDLTTEQILLMEADLLDEEGALAICWDGLACGITEEKSYDASLQRTQKESAGKLENNPMITPEARRIWREKQELVKSYVQALQEDLEEATFDSDK